MKNILPAVLKALIVIIILIISGCATMQRAQETVSFCAAGDIMLDRGVKKHMLGKGGFYPFRDITGFIKRHDLSFCNLEGPVSARGKKKPKLYSFRFDPALMEGLGVSGFNMFSLANNHILDYGGRALLDTVEFMEEKNYFYSGAGKNKQEASAARYREINGIKFAFIANVDMYLSREKGSSPQAFERSGLNEISAVIREAKKNADYVIVSFHWGEEYKNYPAKRQQEYGRACVDSGADLVIGHHPHVMQGIEKYKGKIILYSLGNFIFDQRRAGTNEAMVFFCRFTKDGIIDTYVLPVRIKKGRPDFAAGKDAEEIKNRIMAYSKDFNIQINRKNVKIEIE
jgi:poly-gamma-glutamate capsule biosynthesis protein CapA/YwtB (metallophosphatase superfamily)